MNKYAKIALATVASISISLAVFVLSYNFFPINIFDEQKLGATVTTINGSDTLKNSRTVLNDNFANLNADKMEKTAASSTYLTVLSNLNTVGTISSGIWHGSVIDVQYGGTGRSTLTANGVLLGNGTNGLLALTTGSAGQVLMASSTGVPYWADASVNQSLNYSWSGQHSFSSTTATTTFSGKVSMATATVTSLNIGATSTASLVNGGTSTVHYHPIAMGYFSKNLADASYTGTTTITHNLGVIPRMIKIEGGKVGDSSGYLMAYSRGTYLNGNIQTFYQQHKGSVTYATNGVNTSYIVYIYDSSDNTMLQTATMSVSTSTITLSWVKTSTPVDVDYFTWEAYY